MAKPCKEQPCFGHGFCAQQLELELELMRVSGWGEQQEKCTGKS